MPGELKLFDFCHENGEEKSRRTTVLLFASDHLELPAFRVQPKNSFFKLGELFIRSNNELDDYPEFLEHYRVTGKNMEEIKYVLKPEVIDFFTHKNDWSMEGAGHYLIIYRKNRRVKINSLMPFYRQSARVCRWMLFSDKNDFV